MLVVSSSHMLPELRLQGTMLAGITVARLNGRELPLACREPGNSVVIAASAWADPRPIDVDVTGGREPRYGRGENLEARTMSCAE